jgi:hypothetical protein
MMRAKNERVRFDESNQFSKLNAKQRADIISALTSIQGGLQTHSQYEYELMHSILSGAAHHRDRIVVTNGLHYEYFESGLRIHFDVKIESRNYDPTKILHVYVFVDYSPVLYNCNLPGVSIMPNGSVMLHELAFKPRLRITDVSAF